MEGRRGGRVQVNVLQYQELVERVERLEAILQKPDIGKVGQDDLTKKDIMEMLDHRGISYTTRDTRDDLIAFLNDEGADKCQKDKQEQA